MTSNLTKKYYSIGDVSEILGIPTHTLRYWESKFSILKPTRNSGRQRRYTPKDIERIMMVRFLVKDRGLHIEAAVKRIATDPEGLERRFRAVETMKKIKDELQAMLDALHKLR